MMTASPGSILLIAILSMDVLKIMRLANYTKGRPGHVQASGSTSPSFGNSSKLEEGVYK